MTVFNLLFLEIVDKLYYVVSKDNWETVEILDNEKKQLSIFRLLYNRSDYD